MYKMAILCGGKGIRLKPITDTLPKALVSIGGKPMISHILDKYSDRGIKDYVLCIGYKGEMIKNYLKDKSSVKFVDSGEGASMLKRVFDLKDHVDEDIIVGYCDTITDLDFNDLLNKHKLSNKLLTMVLAEIKSPFGIVKHDNHQVHSFEEKPVLDYYIGTFVMNKDAFAHMNSELIDINSNEGMVRYFQKMTDLGQVGVYKYNGKQLTFNTSQEKEVAEKEINAFYTMREENGDNNSGNGR